MKITFNITKWEIKRIVDNKEWLLLRFDTKQGTTRKTNIWYNKIIKAFEEAKQERELR